MYIAAGQRIQRTMKGYPSNDVGINNIRGATFEVTAVEENYVEVRCIGTRNYPPVGTKMSIPTKYLTEEYFEREN